ncbi:MAG TPA: proliferating cell nuclear antigen (pcna), partial [Nitrososphaeraceae archaeon]|nr:proliferating cell nuclear antigen (pcna) [Nitrososphaeraceae archaeon]
VIIRINKEIIYMSSSKSISELHFFTIAKTSEIWKSISSAIMTIIDEALFDAGPQGITFRSMDPSHIALIDINWPSSAFEKYHCDSTIKFGVRIDEFSKIIKRANTNDSIEIGVVSDNSSLNIKTTGGGYLRDYKMRLIESTGNRSPLPQMIFDSKIVIGIATLDKILSDVGAISEKITIDSSGISTNKKTVIFSGDSDRGEAKVTMDVDDDNNKSKVELLEEITVKENSKSTYNIDFISKIIRAIGHQSSNLVTMEYSSNKPLRLEFLLSGVVKLQFYLAPRVQD